MNLERAYQVFDSYLNTFDRANAKIRLKVVHTDGVVRCAGEIARRMGLAQEDCQLAELIALLHDIGRFEQVRRFDTFEPGAMDHAAFGVELLFGGDHPWIRDFIEEDSFDDIIRTAIGQHSQYALDPIDDERTLLHARLIRDADKLDNCRVKIEDSLQVLLGMTAEEAGKLPITDKIWETCRAHRSIISADRITKMDYWVSYIAYFFDINFKATWDIIREEDYVHRIIARIPYSNEDTKRKMEELEEMLAFAIQIG